MVGLDVPVRFAASRFVSRFGEETSGFRADLARKNVDEIVPGIIGGRVGGGKRASDVVWKLTLYTAGSPIVMAALAGHADQVRADPHRKQAVENAHGGLS